MRQFYRRRLPHWQPPGAVIFITYRLFGSLPPEAVARLAEEKQRLSKESPRAGESRRDRALREGKRLFALADEALDSTQAGPQYLKRTDIAAIVMENLFHHAGNLYRLWAFAIMPNHVHVLLEPLARTTAQTADLWRKANGSDFVALSRIMHALKSYTAHCANSLLELHQTFWQEESYDHWIRSEKEFSRVAWYIENNPVKAGLVDAPEKWQWSSAAFERDEDGACINRRVL